MGLLIAVGLEQVVEYFHHRHQVTHAREEIRQELDLNIEEFGLNTHSFQLTAAALRGNLAVFTYLHAHPGAPPETWPAKLDWSKGFFRVNDGTWSTVQQSGISEHMPHAEMERNALIYSRLRKITEAAIAAAEAIDAAQSYQIVEPDAHRLDAAAIAREIDLTRDALLRLAQFAPDVDDDAGLPGISARAIGRRGRCDLAERSNVGDGEGVAVDVRRDDALQGQAWDLHRARTRRWSLTATTVQVRHLELIVPPALPPVRQAPEGIDIESGSLSVRRMRTLRRGLS